MEKGSRPDTFSLPRATRIDATMSRAEIIVDATFENLSDNPTSLLRALQPWFQTRRWYGQRGFDVGQIDVLDWVRVSSSPDSLVLAGLVKTPAPKTGPDEARTFFVPLSLVVLKQDSQAMAVKCKNAVLEISEGEYSHDYSLWLLRGLSANTSIKSERGFFRHRAQGCLPDVSGIKKVTILGKGDTTNVVTKIDLEDSGPFVLKTYKSVAESNPEPELLSTLAEAHFESIPKMLGQVVYSGSGQELVLAVLQQFEESIGDGRQPFAEALRHELTGHDKPESVSDSLAHARRLGNVVASMHLVLSVSTRQGFGLSEITERDVEEWETKATGLFDITLAEVQRKERHLGNLIPDLLPELSARRGRVLECFTSMEKMVGTPKIRTHQDLHLAQFLTVRKGRELDFLVIDFEGDPQRNGAARRQRESPTRDLGTMARSFSYLRYYVLRDLLQEAGYSSPLESVASYDLGKNRAIADAPERGLSDRLFSVSKDWELRFRKKMIEGYMETVNASESRLLSGFGKLVFEAIDRMVGIWELEKALLELNYELSYRPENVLIPIVGILALT